MPTGTRRKTFKSLFGSRWFGRRPSGEESSGAGITDGACESALEGRAHRCHRRLTGLAGRRGGGGAAKIRASAWRSLLNGSARHAFDDVLETVGAHSTRATPNHRSGSAAVQTHLQRWPPEVGPRSTAGRAEVAGCCPEGGDRFAGPRSGSRQSEPFCPPHLCRRFENVERHIKIGNAGRGRSSPDRFDPSPTFTTTRLCPLAGKFRHAWRRTTHRPVA